jgi:tetratricopeptide (TPR) repeat protein
VLLLAAIALAGCKKSAPAADTEEFTRLSNLGKSQLEGGDAAKAADLFRQALALKPTLPEAQLNLANALLLASRPADAIGQAQRVLQVEPNSAAAHYLIGCAHLRLGQAEDALKALQQSHKIDPAVTALNFQLGLAHERLGHNEEALQQFQTVIEFEPEHLAAHYRLGQLLLRLGRQAEAAEALKRHQEILSKKPGIASDVAFFERCKHTQAKLPFKLEQPLPEGVKVAFTDATASIAGDAAACRAPLAVIDFAHDGRNSLFVREGDGFRLLVNSNGTLAAQGSLLPGLAGAGYHRALVGDLQNDQTEDVVVLGEKGSHVFKFTTNGAVTEVTRAAGFTGLSAIDGALLDFDYTGKLGLLALQPDAKGVRAFRNLSSAFALYFTESGVTSGLPASVAGARHLGLEDWNNDELMDVTIVRDGQPPLVFTRERGGPFVATNLALPAGTVLASGDLNNDSLPDAVVRAADGLRIHFGGGVPLAHLALGTFPATELALVDYDNDGWLDILVVGDGLRAWRNRGQAGFLETTRELGFDTVAGKVTSLVAADFDGDCDIDLAVAIDAVGLKLLRNDGGSANHMLKLRLAGRRSNASGLAVRFEISAGGLRAWRTVKQLPIEIGVGQHTQVDSVAVRWFDGFINHDEIKVTQCHVLTLDEIEKPTGSCPYLYAWDGRRFRFVTDLLGASPLGLPMSDTRFIEADPDEYVWIGDEAMFPPRDGSYVLQVTEELREVLYLDEAKLVVVDHPPGTEVHTTGRLRPGKPFPPHELVTLHRRQPLLNAVNDQGREVTALLNDADSRLVSPTKLRARQLRGLAEPHSVTLDFGPLAVERPLVLALTGWLRFGGGMANIGAAHTPGLPFPFPVLEVEVRGQWQRVDVVVGAPAGKTKTILVDLAGKLPLDSHRLRLSAAFEIHWDRMALFEKRNNSQTRITTLAPTKSDLHWRGYSEFEPWPWFLPLTPNYTNVKQTTDWTITPAGWCTRYGPVDELIGAKDNALALLNGGDELTLQFAVSSVPPKPAGAQRDFLFSSAGWDKDADFHCKLGWQVEPLPWHGMQEQLYGRQPRPAFDNDDWIKRYNTRWVGPHTLTQRTSQTAMRASP